MLVRTDDGATIFIFGLWCSSEQVVIHILFAALALVFVNTTRFEIIACWSELQSSGTCLVGQTNENDDV